MAPDPQARDAAPATHSIDLYGSWDNFSKPYRMLKDSQVGNGRWYGCHLFNNIICDGDPSQPAGARNGALKTGGTYWYYYLRNGYVELHDPTKPHTSFCPLLPGQTVNLLEVPELESTSTSSELCSMTLDPADRRRNPKPASKRRRESPRPPSQSFERRRDMRRHEYMSEALSRLQTAAADALTMSFLGHWAWNYDHLFHDRPRSAPALFKSWILPGSARAHRRATPTPTPTPPREEARRFGRLLDRFEWHSKRRSVRSVVGRPQTTPLSAMTDPSHSLGGDDASSQCPRPWTAPEMCSSSRSSMQQLREEASLQPTPWPAAPHQREDLQLRDACARLGATQAEESLSSLTEEQRHGPSSLLQRLKNGELEPTRARYSRVEDASPQTPQPWTPDTGSPLSAVDFWGSPIVTSRRMSFGSATTVDECLSRSFGERAGLGVKFTDLNLGSQETIRGAPDRRRGAVGDPACAVSADDASSQTLVGQHPQQHHQHHQQHQRHFSDLNYLAQAIV